LWRNNLKIDPGYLPTLLSLAKALDSRGDNQAAIGYYRQAACLEPRYAGVLRALAILERKVHRYQDASDDLEAALDLSPRDAELLELKGDLENEIGNRTGARLPYQQALDNFTVSSMRRRIHTKLKRIGDAR
jgi:Flp pilus assembly protein TadD